MTIPHMLYAGATSGDPDFIVAQSPKQRLLSDPRITRWFAARDNDVTFDPDAPTKIATLIDRKGGGNASSAADDSLKPTLEASGAFGGRKAALFAAGADRSVSVPSLDLSSAPLFVAALVRRGVLDSVNGDAIFWTGGGEGTPEVRMAATPSGSAFQAFVRSVGVNIPAGGAAPDTAPRLVLMSYDGSHVKGALGSAGSVVSAVLSGGILPAAGMPAFIGKRTFSPVTYWGGSIAQVLIGNVDILATAHADLRALLAEYLSDYYGTAL